MADGEQDTNIKPAGFGLRLLARWIDTNIILMLGLFSILFVKLPTMGSVILTVLYFGILHGLSGQTVGKKILKIQLVQLDGGKVSFPKAFVRTLADFLNGITMGLGYLLALFTAKKQALHDIVCKTQVVPVGPCPFWAVILSLAAPPVAWLAIIFTVGLSAIAMVAGPLLLLGKQGSLQPNVNIQVTTTETPQQKEAVIESFPEEEKSDKTNAPAEPQQSIAKVAVIQTAPTPSASPVNQTAPPQPQQTEPTPRPKATALTPPKARFLYPTDPVAAPQSIEAAKSAIEEYLANTYEDQTIADIAANAMASDALNRATAEVAFQLANQPQSARLLLVHFVSGWKVVRPLDDSETINWTTGKIVQK